MEVMKKQIALGLAALGTAAAMLPLFAAFEAHVINVTARIENALYVPMRELTFGTVFPQEKLDRFFDVQLSQSFRAEDRVDDVDYFIRQKPKCWNGNEAHPVYGQVTEDGQGNFHCVDANFQMLPLLCPYLSKHEVSTDGTVTENDGAGISAFHGPTDLAAWTMSVAKRFDVKGHLAKAQQDFDDKWDIDLKVPCFGGYCAQDWASFVHGINPDANSDQYTQPIANEHKIFGCDLWLEVTSISLPGLGCKGKIDVMLVLDRSGSISDVDPDGAGPLKSELQTMKDAAKAFVDALVPSVGGPNAGQVSFSTTATLDLGLSSDPTAIKAAIDSITSGGTTNLADGISTAQGVLDSADRPDGEAPDIMIILTDGAPNVGSPDGPTAAKVAADTAKSAGTEIFAVGIGTDTSTSAFLHDDIVSDVENDHYFDSVDFSSLEAILKDLVKCD